VVDHAGAVRARFQVPTTGKTFTGARQEAVRLLTTQA
jgi:hypothetical protein